MKLRSYKNFFKDAFKNIYRNRVMSIASIVAIMSALFIMGVVLVLIFNLEHIAGGLESKIEVTMFLDKSLGSTRSKLLEGEVAKLDGVYDVEYISRDKGLEIWKENLGEKGSLLDGYDEDTNPLPDKIILKVEKPEYVDDIIPVVKAMSGVNKVNYSREVVETIDKIVKTTRIVGIWFMIVLFVVAAVIINNAVKMTVYARRNEINIMKYIGATNGYIRWPFIIEGFTLGIIAAILAGALVIGVYNLLLDKSAQMVGSQGFVSLFQPIPMNGFIYEIGLIFLLVGCGVGVVASMFSIRKHLEV